MSKNPPDWNTIFQTAAGAISGGAGAYAASQYVPPPMTVNWPLILLGGAGLVGVLALVKKN